MTASVHAMVTALELEKADGTFEPLLKAGSRHIEKADGLSGLEVRQQIRVRPGRHGILNISKFRDSQPIVIEGQLFGDNAQDAWDEYNAVVAACAAAVNTDRTLKWSGGTGAGMALQNEVRVVTLSSPILVAQDVIKYQLIMRPKDPRSLSQVERTVDTPTLGFVAGGLAFPEILPIFFNPAGGGSASFFVSGTDSTPPLIKIYGSLSAPRVVLQSTGEAINILGSVDVNRHIVIDVDNREVRLDDGQVRNSLYDYSNSTWWELPPGPQVVQLLASSFDGVAYARIIYRPAYA